MTYKQFLFGGGKVTEVFVLLNFDSQSILTFLKRGQIYFMSKRSQVVLLTSAFVGTILVAQGYVFFLRSVPPHEKCGILPCAHHYSWFEIFLT